MADTLKRYTTISSALDVLLNNRITFLEPSRWDDRNDAYFLELHRKHKEAAKIFALCCSRAAETYHHWRVFTPASEGVCIELKRMNFVGSLLSKRRVRAQSVRYLYLQDVDGLKMRDFEDLPFFKRQGFSAEEEWRAITTSDDPAETSYSVPLRVEWINRVVANPWMPVSLFEAMQGAIAGLPGCERLKVTRSSLIDNARWKMAGDQLKAKVERRAAETKRRLVLKKKN